MWLVLWPDTAGTLLLEPLPLRDLRDPEHELDVPFGAAVRGGSGLGRWATMATVRIDLHVHSNASDGTDGRPRKSAVRRWLGSMSWRLPIMTRRRVSPEARAALPDGLTLIPGMELSCQLEGRSVHLLAYLFDPEDAALRAETSQVRDDRTYRAKAMVDKMRELGADVTWEQVSAIADGAVVGRPHLARALATSGAVAAQADVFTTDWIGDGGRAFVGRYAPDLTRAVGLVRAAGGVPVLGHPRSPGYEIPGTEVIVGLGRRCLCGSRCSISTTISRSGRG